MIRGMCSSARSVILHEEPFLNGCAAKESSLLRR